MQLEKLILTDVGTYSGTNEFILSPQAKHGAKRPIVLFGGLNGAGKTTLLTAIRLVLYGRHSVEAGTTQKQYENFLQELTHRSTSRSVQSLGSSISLEFTYARLGELTRYRVVREWDRRLRDVEENLKIFRNADAEPALESDQAQAFLNQLIPSGISQFFFFDGEKIASLARDDSDAVLTDAIRRLLGLDIADRLSSDLAVFLRQRRARTLNRDIQDEIKSIEHQLVNLEKGMQEDLDRLYSELIPALDDSKTEYERRRIELMDRGGAWAVDRKALEGQTEQLLAERKVLEERLREQLSGVAIFTLAPKVAAATVQALKDAQELSEQRVIGKVLAQKADQLKKRLAAMQKLGTLQKEFGAVIDGWISDMYKAPKKEVAAYECADLEARDVIDALTVRAPIAQSELATTYAALRQTISSQDAIQQKLVHAPSDGSLADAFKALETAAKEVASQEVERNKIIEEVRRKTWLSIDLTRKLKKLIVLDNEEAQEHQSERLAESVQDLISAFKVDGAKEKCKSLRTHFLNAFSRLARKSDIIHDAQINPESFAVTLLDRSGSEISKKRLSAGEKQIYAIAMLEALAKASGRSLPIIIDTPLGRLDSKHRHKLVESYFPFASHQVMVLSTDTEVDTSFYQTLQPYISHAYHLIFDEESGATNVEEGYFWKDLNGVRTNAA